ncbi:MAG: hydrogenase maturation nickel metallochaperone HypA [Calditrichaeota bacterium]|nr:hydrogenase maturation nickel metallochaperone HypA [Calditrichota bacterium]
MHELFIAESVVGSAKKSLPPGVEPESVIEIHVQVGQLDAVVPESLQFMFDAVKASHGMPVAELKIETMAVRCRCPGCDLEFGLDLPVFVCPECGDRHVELLRGRGIFLNGIRIDDGKSMEERESTPL